MLLIEGKKADIFICTPTKTGSKSLQSTFRKTLFTTWVQPQHLATVPEQLKCANKKTYRVIVVRNPYQRLASMLAYIEKSNTDWAGKVIRSHPHWPTQRRFRWFIDFFMDQRMSFFSESPTTQASRGGFWLRNFTEYAADFRPTHYANGAYLQPFVSWACTTAGVLEQQVGHVNKTESEKFRWTDDLVGAVRTFTEADIKNFRFSSGKVMPMPKVKWKEVAKGCPPPTARREKLQRGFKRVADGEGWSAVRKMR